MLSYKKPSAWTFETSASSGFGAAFVAGEGGYVILNDPNKVAQKFSYLQLGLGVSLGIKELHDASAAGSTENMPSSGFVGILKACPGDELQRSDFFGFCLSVQISASIIDGRSTTAMLMGIPTLQIGKEMATTGLEIGIRAGLFAQSLGIGVSEGNALMDLLEMNDLIDNSAKAILLMVGASAGLQVGVGATGNLGWVS